MLFDPAVIACVAERAATGRLGPLVVDPVMVATSGDRLLLPEAVETLRTRLLPFAAIVTPNAAEAEVLADGPVRSLEEAREAAEVILSLGPRAVLVKGGHLPGDTVADLLVTASGRERVWLRPRLDVHSPHGCGCTLSAAIAAGLALGRTLETAVDRAGEFVHAALGAARPVGRGSTPLDHCVAREGGW
jgi:hydroxymethylpyrimidine/phosphomethylpyrimidine kinase